MMLRDSCSAFPKSVQRWGVKPPCPYHLFSIQSQKRCFSKRCASRGPKLKTSMSLVPRLDTEKPVLPFPGGQLVLQACSAFQSPCSSRPPNQRHPKHSTPYPIVHFFQRGNSLDFVSPQSQSLHPTLSQSFSSIHKVWSAKSALPYSLEPATHFHLLHLVFLFLLCKLYICISIFPTPKPIPNPTHPYHHSIKRSSS